MRQHRVRAGACTLDSTWNIRDSPFAASVHAEQSAVVNAWANGEKGLTAIAITEPPCGMCRQFLYEIDGGEAIDVLVPGIAKIALAKLLPRAFGPKSLGRAAGLMNTRSVPLRASVAAKDELPQATLRAARTSYAPYSGAFASVGLETDTGIICTGRYAENAAYNPSLPPMAAALVMLRLHAAAPQNIRRVVLVAATTVVDHVANSKAVLATVSKRKLEVIPAFLSAREAARHVRLPA